MISLCNVVAEPIRVGFNKIFRQIQCARVKCLVGVPILSQIRSLLYHKFNYSDNSVRTREILKKKSTKFDEKKRFLFFFFILKKKRNLPRIFLLDYRKDKYRKSSLQIYSLVIEVILRDILDNHLLLEILAVTRNSQARVKIQDIILVLVDLELFFLVDEKNLAAEQKKFEKFFKIFNLLRRGSHYFLAKIFRSRRKLVSSLAFRQLQEHL